MKTFLIGLTLSAWAITTAAMWANHNALALINSQRELIDLLQSQPRVYGNIVINQSDCREKL